MRLLRRKQTNTWTYSQDEVAEQIGQIADLIKQRDKTITHLPSSDKIGEQLDLLNDSITASEKVLEYMLTKNRRSQREATRSSKAS